MSKRAWLAILALAACGSDDPEAPQDSPDRGASMDAGANDATAPGDDSAQIDAAADVPTDASSADAARQDAATPPVDAGPRVTYADVEPIFGKYCIACHAAGGDGPFSLDNYDDSSAYAASAYYMASARMMPPCAAVSQTCGPTSTELATLLGWVNWKTPEQ